MKEYFTIVLVDDDEDDQFICREALKGVTSMNCLATVDNGPSLLDLLESKGLYANQDKITPDLLILDINMPVVDGLQTLERIREKKMLNGTPVFILTTSNKKEHINKAYELGAKKFYTKPGTIKGFEEIFREIINFLH